MRNLSFFLYLPEKMNRVLTTILAVLFAVSAFAQFSVGPRAGLNMAWQSGKYGNWDKEDRQWIFCFNPGVASNYRFTKFLSLEMEILYANTGSKQNIIFIDEQGNETESELKQLFRSIQIPVLAKFTFGKNVRFFGETGPYFDVIVHGQYKIKYDDTVRKGQIKIKKRPDNDNNDDDIMYLDPDTRRRTDFGFYMGAGLEKDMGPGTLVFNFRFGMGFLDVIKLNGNDKPEGYKPFRNRMMSLTFAYLFALGK